MTSQHEIQFITMVSNQFGDKIKLIKSYCKSQNNYCYELFNLTNQTYFCKITDTNYMIQIPIYINEMRYVDCDYSYTTASINSSNDGHIINIRRIYENIEQIIGEKNVHEQFKLDPTCDTELHTHLIEECNRILQEFE